MEDELKVMGGREGGYIWIESEEGWLQKARHRVNFSVCDSMGSVGFRSSAKAALKRRNISTTPPFLCSVDQEPLFFSRTNANVSIL